MITVCSPAKATTLCVFTVGVFSSSARVLLFFLSSVDYRCPRSSYVVSVVSHGFSHFPFCSSNLHFLSIFFRFFVLNVQQGEVPPFHFVLQSIVLSKLIVSFIQPLFLLRYFFVCCGSRTKLRSSGWCHCAVKFYVVRTQSFRVMTPVSLHDL